MSETTKTATNTKENESTSRETNGLTVKEVDLFGDNVMAAQDKDGVIWAGVRWLCVGLGLSEGQRQRQTTNIQSDIVLNKGVANLVLPTNGGNQEVLCLQLDYVPLWLAKISITPNMKVNHPELVEKLINRNLLGIYKRRHNASFFCLSKIIYLNTKFVNLPLLLGFCML